MEAIVLPKLTSDMPSHSVQFNKKWKHLMGLLLADSDFEVLRSVDILLGVDIFSCAVIQCLVLGPPGTPLKINTCFGWALTDTVWNVCAPKD